MNTNTHTVDLADIVARIGLANTDDISARLDIVREIRSDMSVNAIIKAIKEAGMPTPTVTARGWTLLASLPPLGVEDEDGLPIALPSWDSIVKTAGAVYNVKEAKDKFEAEEYIDLMDMVESLKERHAEAKEAGKSSDIEPLADPDTGDHGEDIAIDEDAPAPAPTRSASRLVADAVANLEQAIARLDNGDTLTDVSILAAMAAVERLSSAQADRVALAS